jgi:hypothetical protein
VLEYSVRLWLIQVLICLVYRQGEEPLVSGGPHSSWYSGSSSQELILVLLPWTNGPLDEIGVQSRHVFGPIGDLMAASSVQ